MHASQTSRLRLPALLAVLALLAACGAEEQTLPRGAAELVGPPEHWVTKVALPGESHGMNLRAQGPCRLTLQLEGIGDGGRGFPARVLAAGEAVRLWWEPEVVGGDRVTASAPDEEAAIGRRIGIAARINTGYEDRATRSGGATIFMRTPDPLQAVRHYRPPVQAEPIPFGTRIELATLVVADLDDGELRIRPHARGNRVTPKAGDVRSPAQVRVLRLWLVVEALQ